MPKIGTSNTAGDLDIGRVFRFEPNGKRWQVTWNNGRQVQYKAYGFLAFGSGSCSAGTAVYPE